MGERALGFQVMAGEQLRVTEGKEQGKLVGIDADLLIGRLAPEDEGRLGGDPEISRRHARIARGADGQLAIEDLGSANGTFVNGTRIESPRTLVAGDQVRVGKTVLEVTAVPNAAPEVTLAPAAETMLATAEPEPAPLVLVVTGGAAHGRQLEVEDELVLGRAVSGDGRLTEDNELSRRHARISRADTGVLAIEDLGSANGTYVNGQRITSRVAAHTGRLRQGGLDDDRCHRCRKRGARGEPAGSGAGHSTGAAPAPVARPEPPPAPVAPPAPPEPRPSHARPRRHRSPPRRRHRRHHLCRAARAPAPARRSDRGAGDQPAPGDRVRRLSRGGHHRPR